MLLPAQTEGCNGVLQDETDRVFYKYSDRILRKETRPLKESKIIHTSHVIALIIGQFLVFEKKVFNALVGKNKR